MRILWLAIAFVCCLGADDYVFNNSKGRLVEKSVAFVEGVSKELYLKTGVRFVIDMTDFEKNPIALAAKNERQNYQEGFLKQLKPPFVVFFFYHDAQKIELVANPKDLLDTDKIFFEKIAPLLPTNPKEYTPQRISAMLINGYSVAVDALAQKYRVNITQNFNAPKGATFVKVVIYILLLTLLGAFLGLYFFKKS
ncbi:hypothetical protein HGK49_00780 [Helicobacter pylori]|uniref:hypothetical protein n=1 Tax=Helicobacter pylori TaxID=210 RepID=UPI001923953C|nr:hypothetical protein [Helicobacter pylori]QQW65615.1 hypothetical protein HGK49_00700 [Helicobacter pylori]QQW65621.1 hypothetical protein HGK49_00780 [Helicobacter pylori]